MNELPQVGIEALKIIQVPEQQMVFSLLSVAEGYQVSKIELQIRPAAKYNIMEGIYVMDVQLLGFRAGGTFRMRGDVGSRYLRPFRAAGKLELLQDD